MLKPQLDWCDGHDVVSAACQSAGNWLKGPASRNQHPSDLPIFQADAVLMEQALPLLRNAAIHTPPPGRIQVEGGSSKDSKRVFIAVTDEGPGVPADLRTRIFDKFAHGTTARKRGLGLGLSIVRGLCAHKGRCLDRITAKRRREIHALSSTRENASPCRTNERPKQSRGPFG